MKTTRSSGTLLSYAFAVVLLCAAVFAICAAVGVETTQQASFPVIIGVNTTFDATSGADDAFPGDGQCETAVGNGVCTLRAAIEEANAHAGADGIFFSIPTSDPGYSNGTWTIRLTKALPDITASVNINGPGADKLIVFNNILGVRIFNVTTSGTVNFSGLTMSGGDILNANGAGIQNASTGTVNLTNCVLSNNSCFRSSGNAGGYGGAIYNSNSATVNITSSTIEGNSASQNGGGIYNFLGTLNISNSLLVDNNTNTRNNSGDNSLGGGAIFTFNGTLTVVNSTITNNFGVNGGGIYVAGNTTITSTTLSGNFADSQGSLEGGGGGIYHLGATLNVINSTLSGNATFGFFSGGAGGGILTDGGNLAVTNSTIANNSAFGPGFFGGGGISTAGGGGGGSVTVKSSIIALNSAEIGPDVNGAFTSAGFNLIGKKDGSTGFTAATDKKGTIVSPLNPKLDPKGLRSNGGPTQTVALMTGSPAIDKGTSNGLTGTLTTDQRGLSRTVDNTSITNASGGDGTDIGAFEFGAH